MISTIVRVQIGQDGTLKLPSRFWADIGIEPPIEVELYMRFPKPLKRVPRKTTTEERALFDRAAELLRASYKDADLDAVWQDIKAARRDREL